MLAHRSLDLIRLSLNGRKYTPQGVLLSCSGLAKQSKVGSRIQEVSIASFQDTVLCPEACLRSYEGITSETSKSDKLFLATVAPYKPVTSASVARWIKDTISEAGLEGFNAHSSRGDAATATAMAGTSTQEILSRAGWSNKDTFCKFTIDLQKQTTRHFGQAILSYEQA